MLCGHHVVVGVVLSAKTLSLGASAPEKFVFCVKEHVRGGDCLVTGGEGRKSHVRDLLIE